MVNIRSENFKQSSEIILISIKPVPDGFHNCWLKMKRTYDNKLVGEIWIDFGGKETLFEDYHQMTRDYIITLQNQKWWVKNGERGTKPSLLSHNPSPWQRHAPHSGFGEGNTEGYALWNFRAPHIQSRFVNLWLFFVWKMHLGDDSTSINMLRTSYRN